MKSIGEEAPNDTSYKRCSCHSGHKLLCKLYRTLPPQPLGARFTVFLTSRPYKPTGRLANVKIKLFHCHCQFKTGVPQGGVLLDIAPPRSPVQAMAYADDITITSTHTSTSAAKKYIQPYLHKVYVWTKQNNLTQNPDKTTCTSK